MKIKKIYIIIPLILVLLLGLLFSAKVVTKKYCYDVIQPGMSYKLTAAIMGSKGDDFSSGLRCYWWYLDDGSMLQVYYDYEGPSLTAETIEEINLEDYFVIKRVELFKPQLE